MPAGNPEPVPGQGNVLAAWVSREDFLEVAASSGRRGDGQPSPTLLRLPAGHVFDAGDSVGAARSTALQPRPGPPDILRTLAAGGTGGTLPANSAHQRPRPRKATSRQGVSDLVFFCL